MRVGALIAAGTSVRPVVTEIVADAPTTAAASPSFLGVGGTRWRQIGRCGGGAWRMFRPIVL